MSRPTGDCPICNKPFGRDDDIVYCPSCGAPYHRACYQQQGHCSFVDKHAEGYEYHDPKAPAPEPETGGSTGGMLCPACGTVNDATNVFCENCGTPLHTKANQGSQAGGAGVFGGTAYGGPDLSGDIDGISKRDWASFIGQSAPTYLMRMTQLQRRGRQVSFMPSVFFFTPAYFAYRKMWGWAAVALVSTLVLVVPTILFYAAAAGMPLVPGLDLATLETVDIITSTVSLFIRLMFAMYALSLYRKQAGRQIQDIRQQAGEEADLQDTLVKKGGVSVPGVVLVFALLLGFYLVGYLIFGEGFLQALLPYGMTL